MNACKQPEPQHAKLTDEQREAFVRECYGEFAWIARQLGFSRAYVSMVWRGERTNRYVSRAIDAALVVYNRRKKRPAA